MPVIIVDKVKFSSNIPVGKFCDWKDNHGKRNVDLLNNRNNISATTPSKKIVDVANEHKRVLFKRETFKSLIESEEIDDPDNCFLVAQFFCSSKSHSFDRVGVFLCLKKKGVLNDTIISNIYLGHDVIGGIDSFVNDTDFTKVTNNYSERMKELKKITNDFNNDKEGVAHSIAEVRNWFISIPDEIAIYPVQDDYRRRTVVFADASLPENLCSTVLPSEDIDLYDQGSTCCPIT